MKETLSNAAGKQYLKINYVGQSKISRFESISAADKNSVLKILKDHTATIIDTSAGKHKRKELTIVIKDSQDKTNWWSAWFHRIWLVNY